MVFTVGLSSGSKKEQVVIHDQSDSQVLGRKLGQEPDERSEDTNI